MRDLRRGPLPLAANVTEFVRNGASEQTHFVFFSRENSSLRNDRWISSRRRNAFTEHCGKRKYTCCGSVRASLGLSLGNPAMYASMHQINRLFMRPTVT